MCQAAGGICVAVCTFLKHVLRTCRGQRQAKSINPPRCRQRTSNRAAGRGCHRSRPNLPPYAGSNALGVGLGFVQAGDSLPPNDFADSLDKRLPFIDVHLGELGMCLEIKPQPFGHGNEVGVVLIAFFVKRFHKEILFQIRFFRVSCGLRVRFRALPVREMRDGLQRVVPAFARTDGALDG